MEADERAWLGIGAVLRGAARCEEGYYQGSADRNRRDEGTVPGFDSCAARRLRVLLLLEPDTDLLAQHGERHLAAVFVRGANVEASRLCSSRAETHRVSARLPCSAERGGSPLTAILRSLANMSPHALHSERGPVGPRRHSGVSSTPQPRQACSCSCIFLRTRRMPPPGMPACFSSRSLRTLPPPSPLSLGPWPSSDQSSSSLCP